MRIHFDTLPFKHITDITIEKSSVSSSFWNFLLQRKDVHHQKWNAGKVKECLMPQIAARFLFLMH